MSNTISIPATMKAIENSEAQINNLLALSPVPRKDLNFEYDWLESLRTTLRWLERRERRRAFFKRIFRK